MKKVLRNWSLLMLAVLAAAALSVVACSDDNDNGSKTPAAGKTTVAAQPTLPPDQEKIGVTDTEIKIGALLPLSNTTAAAWGVPIKGGMQAYFDWVNDNGGIYGRKLNLIIGDSQYTGPVASEATRKLVGQDKVFAMMGGLGTDAEGAVYKYLEENGVPDMFLETGETSFTDPIAYTRYGWLVNYLDEGKILGEYIGKTYPGKKLGILAQNDDFGKQGEQGLKNGIEGAGMTVGDTEYYDPTQTDVTAQMQRLKAQNVDVIGFYGMPAQAASGISSTRKTLNWDVPFVITGVDAAQIVGALAGYENIQGTVTVSFGYQSDQTDNPGVAKYLEILAKYSPGTRPDSINLSAYAIAEAMVHVLIMAGPDLTRTGFLDAAESVCKFSGSTGFATVSTSKGDHRWNESELFVKGTGTGDAFSWVPFGDPVVSDTTKDCTPKTPPADAAKQPQTGSGG